MISRLIHPRSSVFEFQSKVSASKIGQFISTDSTKVDEQFKVEDAETVNVPIPPTEKLLVLGGNGFVGSHICREAVDRGLTVASLSRELLKQSYKPSSPMEVLQHAKPLNQIPVVAVRAATDPDDRVNK